jgi:hypothetical protein
MFANIKLTTSNNSSSNQIQNFKTNYTKQEDSQTPIGYYRKSLTNLMQTTTPQI